MSSPQLPQWRRRYPAFGQSPHAQQIDQIGGILLVIFHPAVAPIVSQRVGEADAATALVDHVGRPVPPIRCFQDHFGVLTGLGQLGGQGHPIVVDTHSVEGVSPDSVRRTITLRRRCRSIPTYCCSCSTGVSFCRFRIGLETTSVLRTPGSGRREDSRWAFGFDRLDLVRVLFVGTRTCSHTVGARAGALTGAQSRRNDAALLHHIRSSICIEPQNDSIGALS